MIRRLLIGLVIGLAFCACKKGEGTIVGAQPSVTSAQYIDRLLFVNANNYQIQTSAPATFASADTNIKISSTGLVAKIWSGEVVPIVITWKDGKTPPTTIYALGATDINQPEPAAYFHGETATDPYDNYVQGWKLLETLPDNTGTYAMVLRHADASFGRDWPTIHTGNEPANWWKSTDSLLARQLNTKGIQRATEIGVIIKDLQYPIKRVVTSEYNRAIQTASLINLGVVPTIDPQINHLTHNLYVPGPFEGVLNVVQGSPIDNNMTLIVTHHPANEPPIGSKLLFPTVSTFDWSGAYFIKLNKDTSMTYSGGVSYGMLKYWHDLKLNKL